MLKFQGWDLALNHSGFVEINEEGRITAFRFSAKQKSVCACPEGRQYDASKHEKWKSDKELVKMERLAVNRELMKEWLSDHPPDYVVIEHYALGKKHNAYHIGELGGTARGLLQELSIPFRLWGPGRIKAFATLSGKAEKIEMIDAAKNILGKNWIKYDRGLKSSDTAGDLADAHWMAAMALTEYQMKEDLELTFKKLSEKKLAVVRKVKNKSWM